MNDLQYVLDLNYFATVRKADVGSEYEADIFDAGGNYVGTFNARSLDRLFAQVANYIRRIRPRTP